jgi:hypothetical protein
MLDEQVDAATAQGQYGLHVRRFLDTGRALAPR